MHARQLYLPSPGPGNAIWLSVGYLDAGLRRVELVTVSREDDAYVDWTRRESPDNGRTWSAPTTLPDAVRESPRGGIVEYPSPPHIDPRTGIAYLFTMQRIWPGQKCYTYDFVKNNHHFADHVFVSENGGPNTLLRYQSSPGDGYDPQNPFAPAYLEANHCYFGTHPAFTPDSVCYPVVCSGKTFRDRLGICLFRREKQGLWRASNLQNIAPELSAVGLEEPAAVTLKNGNILIVCRGHCTATMQGVKWMSLSTDGGKTISPIEEFRYSDGSRLFSPSSIHRFIRSTRNGKLYWLANITDKPPEGQGPRYPLTIAEVDEDKAAIIKESVAVLDDRRAGEPEALQLSNFSLLENRETLDLELYVTLLGLNANDFWGADVYRYVFSPPAN
jgi:hypothetical protein